MPYITEIKSYITFSSKTNKAITLQMEIESGKSAKCLIPVDNHLEAFVELINGDLTSLLLGYNVLNQDVVDQLIKNLAKELKRKIPNEITLALSMVVAKLASMYYDIPLFKYLGGIKSINLPVMFISGEYPLKGYHPQDLTTPADLLLKADKIDKVQKELPNITILDIYSLTASSINNLKKQHPHLKFITLKTTGGLSYQYFDPLNYSTLSELLMNKASFINTKFFDESLSDLALALGAEYVISNLDVLNRMIEIANMTNN